MAGAGNIGSTVPRRELGRRLLKLRNDAGLTRHAAAKKLEWSEPKVWRIETGQIALRTHDVELMCRIYGADEETTAALVALAPETRTKDWWRVYAEAIPQGLDLLFGLELAASKFRWWDSHLVPGILQTEGYARAVMEVGSLPAEEVEMRVRARLDRQTLLLNRVDPPRLHFAIDEDALNRPAAPDMMRNQLQRLHDVSGDLDHVTIRVVPRSTGLHEGVMAGSFAILDFPPNRSGFGEPTTVYSDSWITPLYYTKPQEVDRYIETFDRLVEKSLDEEASRGLIRQYLGRLS